MPPLGSFFDCLSSSSSSARLLLTSRSQAGSSLVRFGPFTKTDTASSSSLSLSLQSPVVHHPDSISQGVLRRCCVSSGRPCAGDGRIWPRLGLSGIPWFVFAPIWLMKESSSSVLILHLLPQRRHCYRSRLRLRSWRTAPPPLLRKFRFSHCSTSNKLRTLNFPNLLTLIDGHGLSSFEKTIIVPILNSLTIF